MNLTEQTKWEGQLEALKRECPKVVIEERGPDKLIGKVYRPDNTEGEIVVQAKSAHKSSLLTKFREAYAYGVMKKLIQ